MSMNFFAAALRLPASRVDELLSAAPKSADTPFRITFANFPFPPSRARSSRHDEELKM